MKATILSILALLLMTVTQGAWSQTHNVTFADGNDNEGWTIDLTYSEGGTTVTVSYTGSHKVKSIAVTGQVSVTDNGDGTYSFQMPANNVEVSTELWYKVDEEKTPAENIAAYGTKSNFFLNRTLKADVWNTFASPFAIAAGDMEKYFGAEAKVRKLNTTSVAGTVLTLNFTDATAIVAGQPYLVKPAANVDFSANGKEFENVSLTAASATPTPTTYVNFVPTLGKTKVNDNPKNILMLNTSGNLVHPSEVDYMKGFRGFFVIHDSPAQTRSFVIDFGDGETTGIQPVRMENGSTPAEAIYDLSGRRMQSQPTQKGVYIQNGKKVVIK